MKANDIFQKTSSGVSEIDNRSDTLTVKQRRVLILVNGENNTTTLRQLSLCDDITDILETLLRQGFINYEGGGSAYDYAQDPTLSRVPEARVKDFMCNTLLSFANRIKVGGLIDQIKSVEDTDSLKNLVAPWYRAILEAPGGTYQADDLKNEVMQMINDEGIVSIR